MVRFLANVLEQLDLALEQLTLSDPNYKRFALMLVDNAVELTLHEHAVACDADNTLYGRFSDPRHDPKLVAEALSRHFDPKVTLARHTGLIAPEVAESLLILHDVRNMEYHRGLRQEGALPALTLFYFRVACDVHCQRTISEYSWTSNDVIPPRARKYVGENPMSGDVAALFKRAFARLREEADVMPLTLQVDLARHMSATIDSSDELIGFLANDGPSKLTRDEVILQAQAWPLALSDAGRRYAEDSGFKGAGLHALADWLLANYSFPISRDPVPSWQRRLRSLQEEKKEHSALKKYADFLSQTEAIRSRVDEMAAVLDQHIQMQVDHALGK